MNAKGVPNLISVVIPVYNRPRLCLEALASVLAQNWEWIEVIFVDDGSNDDTPLALSQIHATHPGIVRVLTQKNAGPGASREAGWSASRGEFIQFLDSDDVLLPGKFYIQVAALRRNPEAGIAYGRTSIRHADGSYEPNSLLPPAAMPTQVFPSLLSGRLWQTSAPLYRRSALDAIGPWPNKRQMEDWEFDAQAGAAKVVLAPCEGLMSEYRIHTGPRLAHAWMTDTSAMADRLAAHSAIFNHARTAGVSDDSPHMQRFARTLFALAREAGAAGFINQANQLLKLALSIRSHRRWDIHLYALAVRHIGWKMTARLIHGPQISHREEHA